jgi:hypothetical protein
MTKTRLFALLSFILLVFVVARALLDKFAGYNHRFTVADVRELTNSRAEVRPVQFRGVVTLVQDSYFVVQDNTGGIRVRASVAPKISIYGHLVEVTGTTPVGPGEDSIYPSQRDRFWRWCAAPVPCPDRRRFGIERPRRSLGHFAWHHMSWSLQRRGRSSVSYARRRRGGAH